MIGLAIVMAWTSGVLFGVAVMQNHDGPWPAAPLYLLGFILAFVVMLALVPPA